MSVGPRLPVRPIFASPALGLLVLAALGCERAQTEATAELPHDAAFAPVTLAKAPEPRGITRFDCAGTQGKPSQLSLRAWASPAPAGAAQQLQGQALACDVTLHSDCAGRAELRVSAGLARSEKVVTAVSPDSPASVQLRLEAGSWERALEPSEGTPFADTLQLVARAEVRCGAPGAEPRPRYWTDSFITGLAGAPTE